MTDAPDTPDAPVPPLSDDTAPPPARTVGPRRRGKSNGLRDANGNLIQPGPYTLQASCELSEDYFLTSDVVIGINDQVVPFVNPKNNNAVEALVYAGGTLSHLRRDASATSGWTYETVDLQGALSDVTSFAVAANATDVYLLAFGDPVPPGPYPAWLTTLDGPDTWDFGNQLSYDDLQWTPSGPVSIKGGIDGTGICYFYTSNIDGDTTTLQGWVASGTGGGANLNYQQYLTLDTTEVTVSDYIVLFDSNATAPVGYAFVFTSSATSADGSVSVYQEIPTQPRTAIPLGRTRSLTWASAPRRRCYGHGRRQVARPVYRATRCSRAPGRCWWTRTVTTTSSGTRTRSLRTRPRCGCRTASTQ